MDKLPHRYFDTVADNRDYHPFIDGLRGIAILMVVMVHTSQFVGNSAIGSFSSRAIGQFVNSGARGVQLFFIISAFTLFSSSRRRFLKDKYPKLSFYIRRAFRILPFWWVANICWGMWYGTDSFIQMVPSLFMFFGFLRFLPGVEIVPIGWTIFVEETFYLLLPFVFISISSLIRAIAFFLICLFMAILWLKFAISYPIINHNSFVEQFPLSQWFLFGLGIIGYFIFQNSYLREIIIKKNGALLDLVAVFSVLMFLTQGYMIASISLFALFLASIPSTNIFGTITRFPILKRFGAYCYSIYLIHFLLLYVIDSYRKNLFAFLGLTHSSVELRFLVWFPIISVLCLVIGFVSFHLIEKPSVELGKLVINRLNRTNK